MAIEFNGSSQYLSASSTLLANEPISMVAHFNPDDVTGEYTIASLGNNGSSGYYRLEARGSAGGDPVRASKDNDAGSGEVIANTSSGYSASAWHIAGANFGSDTSRDAFINGGNKGSNTTSRTDPTPDLDRKSVV